MGNSLGVPVPVTRSLAGHVQANASCARSQRSYHLPSSLTTSELARRQPPAPSSPADRERAAAAPPPSLSPSHPPAGLRGRDRASPTRCRERRRAAQRARRGRPAALRFSRNRSRHLWAPGIATPGFKPAGIRGARRGAGGMRTAPLANRRCLARPLASGVAVICQLPLGLRQAERLSRGCFYGRGQKF